MCTYDVCTAVIIHCYGNIQDAIQYALDRENGDIVTV